MLVCSIYNEDVKEFGALMMFPSRKVAEASFFNWIDCQKNKHFDPTDFILYHLADFDIQKGDIVKLKGSKVKIASGMDADEEI